MALNIGSRYVAYAVLGQGTTGTVWSGEGPSGPVAIKLLRGELARDSVTVSRFLQERAILTELSHPNLVGIQDLVTDGHELALVMELIDGRDLRHHLEAERVATPAVAAVLMSGIAEALAAVHGASVIHRDVKPENILLERAEGELRPRLTDFGIARLLGGPRLTEGAGTLGSPDYLAPEVVEGGDATAASDVYAAGVVLYELLCGRTPFGGGSPLSVLRAHVVEAVPGIPGLPASLTAVLSACLSKRPADRPAAAELAEMLRDGEEDLADVPPLVDRATLDAAGLETAMDDVGRTALPLVPAASRRSAGAARMADSRATHLGEIRLSGTSGEPQPSSQVGVLLGAAAVALVLLGVGILALFYRQPSTSEGFSTVVGNSASPSGTAR